MQKIWEVIYSWEDVDHIHSERWYTWYIFAFLFMLFVLIWWIREWVYTMPFVFVIVALVYIYTSSKKPFLQDNKITDLWISIGNKFIPYSDINSFWFIYFSNWSLLYIKTNWKFNSTIVVPVINWDPSIIRDLFIEAKVNEMEWMKEWFDDLLARKLKL